MNTAISLARVRAAGLSEYLYLALRQTVRVAVIGITQFGLAAIVAASDSGTVSYSELCSLLALSLMLTGLLYALIIGVRTFFTRESWQTFISRFASSIVAGVALALLVPTP